MLNPSLQLPTFRSAGNIVFGKNSIMALKGIESSRVAIVVSPSILKNDVILKRVLGNLRHHKYILIEKNWPENFTADDLGDALNKIESLGADTIIAVGGGSVIDACKIIWLLYEHPEYFDDEESPQNKKIGDAAEKFIFDKLKQRPDVEDPQLLGGNNKGYDIEYRKNGVSYFVEVKGLTGSWLDADVLFSRAQFEKAQETGDRFSIFVVEFVGRGEDQDVTEIRDPASFFTKMQLDHGWKNFSLTPEHLQPAVGRVLLRSGSKFIIEDVQKSGTLIRLTLKGEAGKITFNPGIMQIEEPE